MTNIEFRINNQLIDYKDNEAFPLSLTKQIIDYKNVDKRTGEYSFTIIIPFTRANKIVFKNIENLDKTNKFNQIYPYSYNLFVNGIEISKGTFKLSRISEEGYEGILITKGLSWYSLFQGLKLRDVKLTPYEFTNSIGEFETQWALTENDTQHQYPYICYSNFYNTTESVAYQYGNIKISDLNTFRNLPPAVYVTRLIKQMFNDVGLNVAGDIFEDPEFQKLIIPKSGKNEAFWNWKDLGYANVQNTSYQISLNGNPDITGQIYSGRKDVHSYNSCIFQHYVKTVMANGQYPTSPTIGETFCLPQVGSSVYRYDGGVVNNPASYTAIATVNYGDNIYSYNQGGVSGGYSTWAFNGSYRNFDNSETSLVDEDIQNRIIGIVTGAYNVIGNYVINNDLGQNINESNVTERVNIDIQGNEIFFNTVITINGESFTLLETDNGFFGGGFVDVNDSMQDLVIQIEANSTLMALMTVNQAGNGIRLEALDQATDIQVTQNGGNQTDINITSYQGGITSYKYTVPITGFYDIISQHVGTISKSNTDIGVEGYAFFPNGNQINNRNFIAVVRNFGSEGVTPDELIQECYDFVQGNQAKPESVVGYIDIPGNSTNPDTYNSFLTQGLEIDLTEGDNLTVVHLVYVVGYLKPTVGYRNISTATAGYSGTIFKLSDQAENVVLNYETDDYEPDYELVQLAHILPDMTQQDFIRGIINMFNLYFSYDDISNTLVFYSFSKFYKPKEFAFDITKLIDDEQFTLEPIVAAKTFSIEYAVDPKETYLFYNKYERIDDTIYSEGSNIIKFPFSQTFNNTFRFYDNSVFTLPHMYNAKDSVAQNTFLDEYNFDFGPRILQWEYLDTDKYLELNRGQSVGLPITSFPFDYLAINQLFTSGYQAIFENVSGKERLILKGYLNEYSYKKIRLDVPVKYKYNYYVVDSISKFSPIDFNKECEISLIKI